jgi:hypothetical protein
MSGKRKKNEKLKELLFKDYDYLADSFWKNEQSGETRVNLFIGLLTLVVGALVTLSTTDGLETESLRLVFVLSLGFLLVLGLITFLRILKRNKYTSEIKLGLDEIRKTYKEIHGLSKTMKKYSPIIKIKSEKEEKTDTKRSDMRKIGGLAYTMTAINSIIITGIAGTILYPTDIQSSSERDILVLIGIPFLVFIVSFFLQYIIIFLKEKEISDFKERRKKNERETISRRRNYLQEQG